MMGKVNSELSNQQLICNPQALPGGIIQDIAMFLMISFASVNAVLFTPALPSIANFFSVSTDTAQQTITLFLVGYALGQLVYGPLANRFGRKPALYAGICVQIISSFLCVFAGFIHEFSLLVLGRFLLALGSGVGLKMTFTLINERYEPKLASQKIAYLILVFAITPGLSVALGGILTTHFGWMSCFYAGAIYGVILLLLVTRVPETLATLDLNALKIKYLLHEYYIQFKNTQLIAGGLLMGGATSFIYAFAAVAPFIAINTFGMNSSDYGFANILPPIGLILGSLVSAQLAKRYSLQAIIFSGILITSVGVLLMLAVVLMHLPVLFSLFLPMILIYFGLCFVIANASTIALSHVSDKAHGSAVMSFLNMGLATIIVLSLGLLPMKIVVLPSIFVIFSIGMMALYKWLIMKK